MAKTQRNKADSEPAAGAVAEAGDPRVPAREAFRAAKGRYESACSTRATEQERQSRLVMSAENDLEAARAALETANAAAAAALRRAPQEAKDRLSAAERALQDARNLAAVAMQPKGSNASARAIQAQVIQELREAKRIDAKKLVTVRKDDEEAERAIARLHELEESGREIDARIAETNSALERCEREVREAEAEAVMAGLSAIDAETQASPEAAAA